MTNTKEDSKDLDLHLAALSAIRAKHGYKHAMTTKEIADVCGCSHQNITLIEERALKKIKLRLQDLGINGDDANLFSGQAF
jgi:DNA-directed RNA polymerase specialized sigma24 family protein